MDYAELLDANRRLGEALDSPQIVVRVLSNITIDPIKEILEYALRTHSVNAVVTIGGYDNVMQESSACGDAKAVLIFWEAAALLDGLQSKGRASGEGALAEATRSLAGDVRAMLNNLVGVPLLLVNLFSTLAFTDSSVVSTPEKFCDALNAVLKESDNVNLLLVDLAKIFAQVSLARSIDWRFYYLNRALYTFEFLQAYVAQIEPVLLSVLGKGKKAVIFDCDNTLWGGIVGEDGLEQIELSPETARGRVFRDVQAIARDLYQRGVLLGLCSKNQPEDVAAVLAGHRDAPLREEMIVVKRINWEDKVSNLLSIGAELNISMESLVFVDDSPHEILAVQQQLPEVECFQVPENLFQYPAALRVFLRRFQFLRTTAEDSVRTEMYRSEAVRKSDARSYSSDESFLRSLGLVVSVHIDPRLHVTRIAQLTQKTNQFNLTTVRYTEEEIQKAIESPDHIVVAVGVEDRFGGYGITGATILALDRTLRRACIDTFLLSCRVLGRKVEAVLLDCVVDLMRREGIEEIRSRYSKTQKNSQVADFYDRAGFTPVTVTERERTYRLQLRDYRPFKIEYVRLNYA